MTPMHLAEIDALAAKVAAVLYDEDAIRLAEAWIEIRKPQWLDKPTHPGWWLFWDGSVCGMYRVALNCDGTPQVFGFQCTVAEAGGKWTPAFLPPPPAKPDVTSFRLTPTTPVT